MRDHSTDGPSPIDRVLLVRFVAGEATPAETAVVEQWLAEPSHGEELAELRRIWALAEALPSDARLEGLWDDLRRRMHETPVVSVTRSQPVLRQSVLPLPQARTRRWRYGVGGALAAAGIAAVIVGAIVRPMVRRASALAAFPGERVYSTTRGQRSVIELADGSRVELGVDSRLRVRLDAHGRREVRLEGEAVFDVVHDQHRPFLVYSANAITEDLGTKFGIRAYAGDSVVRVFVAAGKVGLRPARPQESTGAVPVLLGPGDLGELNHGGETRVRHNVDAAPYLAWTRDRLVFQQTSLAEVVTWLERWYDVEIAVPDSAAAATRRITLELEAPSLDEALEAVAVPLGLRYRRDGRRVTLQS